MVPTPLSGFPLLSSSPALAPLPPVLAYVLVTQLCLTLCDPTDCSLPVSSFRGILQARILEWVAISFSRGSSWPRNCTQVSCITGGVFTVRATRDSLLGRCPRSVERWERSSPGSLQQACIHTVGVSGGFWCVLKWSKCHQSIASQDSQYHGSHILMTKDKGFLQNDFHTSEASPRSRWTRQSWNCQGGQLERWQRVHQSCHLLSFFMVYQRILSSVPCATQ